MVTIYTTTTTTFTIQFSVATSTTVEIQLNSSVGWEPAIPSASSKRSSIVLSTPTLTGTCPLSAPIIEDSTSSTAIPVPSPVNPESHYSSGPVSTPSGSLTPPPPDQGHTITSCTHTVAIAAGIAGGILSLVLPVILYAFVLRRRHGHQESGLPEEADVVAAPLGPTDMMYNVTESGPHIPGPGDDAKSSASSSTAPNRHIPSPSISPLYPSFSSGATSICEAANASSVFLPGSEGDALEHHEPVPRATQIEEELRQLVLESERLLATMEEQGLG